MAPAKKKTKSKPSSRSGNTGRGGARKADKASAPTARAPARAKGSSTGQPTEVEQRWNEYWECRTALESAVSAVREAEARLQEAREQERAHRATFDRTKHALRELLEVEPASSSEPGRAEGSARLGVVAGARGSTREAELFDDEDDDREESSDDSEESG